MSKEYIDREEVIKILEHYDLSSGSTPGYHSGAIECAISEIEMLPAADVAEVRHGRWTIAEDDYYGLNIVKCSVCHEEWCFEERDDVFDLNYHYCPNCGSLMDKEEPNEL